ncbi:Multidrug resistance protein MdtE [bacterium HR40]|nr:Multidrug resistance protein MdtE [bacterium HR40]
MRRSSRLGFAMIGLLLSSGAGSAQMPPPQVVVEEVRTEAAQRELEVVGRVVAVREGGVASRIAAPVREVLVQVGDRVEAGAPLVRLDDTRLLLGFELARASRDTAAAELEQARRSLALREQELRRLEGLRRSAAFPRAQYEDKLAEMEVERSRIAAAEARLAQAEVELRRRQADLADAAIAAPYAGVVTAREVSPGEYVEAGEVVVRLIDVSGLEIEADVPGSWLAVLTGDLTAILAPSGTKLTPRAVIPVENPLTRTRAVRFVFLDPQPAHLAVGQSVGLRLAAKTGQTVVTVPKDAVSVVRGTYRVFVVEGDSAQPRTVELGEAIGERFVVLSGLRPGERVVVRGNERLQPGQKVRAVTSSAESGEDRG